MRITFSESAEVTAGAPTGPQVAARRSRSAVSEGEAGSAELGGGVRVMVRSAPLEGALAPGVGEGHHEDGDEDQGLDEGQQA